MENNNHNCRINNEKTTKNNNFEDKTKVIGSTPNDNNILDKETVVLLNYLSNF